MSHFNVCLANQRCGGLNLGLRVALPRQTRPHLARAHKDVFKCVCLAVVRESGLTAACTSQS